MRKKLHTEGELKLMPSGFEVHLVYTHPDPTASQYDGPAFVEQQYENKGCWFLIGSKNSSFAMDWTYGEDGRTDESECSSDGGDGDLLEIYKLQARKRTTSNKAKR